MKRTPLSIAIPSPSTSNRGEGVSRFVRMCWLSLGLLVTLFRLCEFGCDCVCVYVCVCVCVCVYESTCLMSLWVCFVLRSRSESLRASMLKGMTDIYGYGYTGDSSNYSIKIVQVSLSVSQ